MATLPSGYTQLNYIENTGQAFIDTGFVPTANTRVVMDFQLTDAGTGNRCLFGVNGQFSFRWYGSSSVFRSNGNKSTDFPTGIDGTARHKVDKTATACTLDGEYSVTTTAGTVTYNLYLLAQNSDGSSFTNPASAKLYSCQIYESGSLVRDFVPCTNAAGTVGVYDTANGVFYASGNAAATFTSGGVYDPTAPVGDHNALVAGAAREIDGGQTLIGGTAHEIDSGQTLISGTVYEIAFLRPVAVSWQGSFDSMYSYISVDGTKYTSKGSAVYEQPPTIKITVSSSASKIRCYVKLNGTKVQDGNGTYTFTPDSGSTVTIKMVYSSDYKYYYAEITTS